MRAKPPAGFLNVDLEIVSRSKLDALETAVSDAAHGLYCGLLRRGVRLLSLETNHICTDADSAILKLCAAIERLGQAERQIWDRALQRTFDVGYELPKGQRLVHVSLRPQTLARITAIGATVAFTCYRQDDDEPEIKPRGGQSVRAVKNRRASTKASRR